MWTDPPRSSDHALQVSSTLYMYNVGTLHTILPPSMYPQPYMYNMGTHTFFHLISILNFPLKTCEVHIVNTTRSVVTVKIYDLSDTTYIYNYNYINSCTHVHLARFCG